MAKPLDYKSIIKDVLSAYVKRGAVDPNAREHKETQLLFDDERGHYQVTRIAWEGIRGIFMVIFHFDLKDGKIWVQRNISDYDIVGDLEEKGVPKSDIVLAFHSPRMRKYTGYAVA